MIKKIIQSNKINWNKSSKYAKKMIKNKTTNLHLKYKSSQTNPEI
jgi:Spy/CpxP family protein refolding chaperone